MDMYYPKDIARCWREYSKNTCFFLMPFADEYRKIYSSLVKELKKIDFYCTRVDLEDQEGAIINRIVKGIIGSHFVVVDLSGRNPNVMYELGLAHALKDRPNVIMIAQDINDVPFDIRHLRVIEYDVDNLFFLVERVRKQIEDNRHGFEIKIILKNNYSHHFKQDSDIVELEELLQSIIEKSPFFLLHLDRKNDFGPLTPEQIQLNMIEMRNKIEMYKNSGGRISGVLVKVYSDLLVAFQEIGHVQKEIVQALSSNKVLEGFTTRENLNHILDLVFKLASNKAMKDDAVQWLVTYIARPKVAGVDIYRSRVEAFIIDFNDGDLNRQLLSKLACGDDLYRENVADILGEMGNNEFVKPLVSALYIENNYFAARSIISALGKIGQESSALHIVAWLKQHIETILAKEKLFVFDYIGPALSAIDYRHGTSYFREFESILEIYG